MHPVDAEIGEHLRQLVVDGLHEGDPLRERSESFTGHGQGFRVTVDTDEPCRRGCLQNRAGVTAETESAIDVDRAGRGEGWDQQLDDAVEHDRIVDVITGRHDHLLPIAPSSHPSVSPETEVPSPESHLASGK